MKAKILRIDAKYSGQVQNLLKEMAGHEDALLNRPNGSGWSAIQTMHHLILVEENSLAYIKKKMGHNPVLPQIGLGVHYRSFLLWAGLYLPIKFKAPKMIGNEYLPEYRSMAETRERWLAARSAWQAYLNEMPDEWADKVVYRHPRAGLLGWPQMLRFFGQHFERHRKQIRRAIAAGKRDA